MAVEKPRSNLIIVMFAVAAVSTAAPAIRLGSSPAIAVAFWRVTLATLGMAMFSGLTSRKLTGVRAGLTPLAGLFLGLHFWAWIASLASISVARSVLLVSTQPVWAALMGQYFLHDRVRARAWLGICLALAGAAVASGGLGTPGRGDLLALAGAALAAGYMVVGRHERQRMDIFPFLVRVYGWAALTLLVALAVTRTQPWPSNPGDWWLYVFLAVVPTGIGHSLYNYALRHLSAHAVATALTLEPVGASILAFFVLGEAPEASTWLAAPLVVIGVLLVVPRSESPSSG
jgi:drug/metabolite transporter (DMT)-like permease